MKLIVSDFDRTLSESLDKSRFLIENLVQKGYCFAVASGREYNELKSFFDDFNCDIYFVSSDGGAIYFKNSLIYSNKIKKIPNINMHKIHKAEEDIVKFSCYPDSYFMSYVKNNRLLKISYQEDNLIEYVDVDTDKAKAVLFLKNMLDIDSIYAIGDNYNDINMLKVADISFSVKGAIPEVMRLCKYNENTVSDILEKILKEDEHEL